jgi:hypothetical protein
MTAMAMAVGQITCGTANKTPHGGGDIEGSA